MYDEHASSILFTKAQVPQTPLSPIDINPNSEIPGAMTQNSPTTDRIPNSPLLESSSADLFQKVYQGHDEKYIQVAQILADQLLAYSKAESEVDFLPELGTKIASVTIPFEDPLKRIIRRLFSHDEICTLEVCASLFDVPHGTGPLPKAIARPVQRKQDSTRGVHDTSTYPFIASMATPNLRVIRGDTLMDISSTALHFWEELGLSPCMGSKDITAFCIYPQTEMVRRGSSSFVRLVSSTFQSLRLGVYNCGSEKLQEFPEGLVPVSLTSCDIEGAMQQIDTVCESLGMHVNYTKSL